MKKKVRIYKAQNGQGAYINKTAKFLKKAQEGGMPDANAMGYPESNQQSNFDEITQSIVTDISNGRPKEETVVRLVQVLGQDPMQTSQYYDQIYSALEQQQDQAEEEAEKSDKPSDYSAQEEVVNNAPVEEIVDQWNSTANQDMSNEIAAEDEDVDYGDDDQVASDIIMQFGGVEPVYAQRMQEGGTPIQFPGMDAYMPSNMANIFYNDTDYLTNQSWSPDTESAAGIEPEVTPQYKQGGNYKKNKRVYVNSILKLAKKQLGGQDMSVNGDTDPRGEDVRKQRLNSFLGTVKNEAQLAKTKEQAEQQFDQMMQQQEQMPMAQFGLSTPSPTDIHDYIINLQNKPKIGVGVDEDGSPKKDVIGTTEGKSNQGTSPYIQGYPVPNIYGNQMMYPRRGIFGRPKMPRGVGFGYGFPISKIDVRRTGIFGRPKEYSIEFGASPMPGMPGAGFYGYGQTSTVKKGKSKGRIITETIASEVNNKSTEDVAKNSDSNAANTSANTTTTNNPSTPGTTANNVQQNTATSNRRNAVNVNTETEDAVINDSNVRREEEKAKNKVQEIVESLIRPAGKKDKWGRSEGSKWYGFDPKTKKWTKGAPKEDSYYNTAKQYAHLAYDKATDLLSRGYNALPDVPDFTSKTTTSNVPKNIYFGPKYQEGGQAYYNPFGGFVDSDNPDLYKFIYGGNDPYFTQGDLDDVYSKDTSDPYFAMGGLTRYAGDEEGSETNENQKFEYTVSGPNKTTTQLSPYDEYRKKIGDKLNMSLRDDLSAKELYDLAQKAGVNNTSTSENKKTTTTTQNQQYNPYGNIGYNGFNIFGNLFPGNLASYQGSWSKIKKGPYNKATGMMMPGYGFGPNTQVRSIDVTKSGMFGRPKKYTVNFSNQEMDPRKQNLITVPGQNTPGQSGYVGQEQSSQQQGNRFSNTKGLGLGSRAKVAMKELFNRYNDDEEVTPTGDVASTSNAPSPSQTTTQEDEVAKFQQQQRKNGRMWDEEKQAWVDMPDIRMDIKKPGAISASPEMQKAADARKQMEETYGSAFPVNDKAATPSASPDLATSDSRGPEVTGENLTYQTKKEIDNTQPSELAQRDYMESQGMGDLYQPEFKQEQTIETPESSEAMQPNEFDSEYEGDQSFDKGYFGQNQFRNYDIVQKQQAAARAAAARAAAQRKQQEAARRPETSNVENRPNVNVNQQNISNRPNRNVNTNNVSSTSRVDRNNSIPERQKKNEPSVVEAEFMRESKRREKAYNAARKEMYDVPMSDLTQRRDKILKNIDRMNISPQEKQKKKEEIDSWYQRQERELFNKYNEQAKWFQEQSNAYEKSNFPKGKGYSGSRQFGGDLNRFTGGGIQFQPGGSPVTYTNNPALAGISNVDMISLNEGIPGLQPSNFWSDQASFNAPAPVNPQKQPDEIKTDVNQISSDQAKKAYQAKPGDYSMDFKVKNTWEIDTPAALTLKNASLTAGAGMLNRFLNRGREAKMYDNLTANNIYASDPSRDRGMYDVNSGLFDPANSGSLWTSRSAKYGGSMYDYDVDDEVEMTPEELKAFLAAGGEIY